MSVIQQNQPQTEKKHAKPTPEAAGNGRMKAGKKKGSSRGWLFVIPLVVLLLGGVAYIRYESHMAKELADPRRARQDGRPIPVRTEFVAHSTYDQINGATGITEASETAIVRLGTGVALADQRVTLAKIHTRDGEYIEAGQTLFEVDDELFSLVCRQRESATEATGAELEALKRLMEDGAASEFQFRQAKVAHELALLEHEKALRDLERCNIESPIAGFVDVVNAVSGEQVDGSRELTTIYKLNPIHMRVDLPQEKITDVTLGQEAEVVLDSFPQETFYGKLVFLSPTVDPETRVLSAVVEIANSDHRIKAGVSGFARFHADREGIVVPTAAIIELDRRAMAFVVVDGIARIRAVRTGPLVETGLTEVIDGLALGEEVVVLGSQYLKEGDEVDTNWRRWTRRD